MNLAWNLTERERLTQYYMYDSVEELGRLAGFQCFVFAASGGSVQNRVCSLYSFLLEERQQGSEVSHFYCKTIKLSAIMLITVLPHTNLFKFKPL